MKVVYFKNEKTGKIMSHQVLPKEWDTHKCNERITDYNNSNNGICAVFVVVSNNSFEEYLLNKTQEKFIYNRESIDAVLSAIDDVRIAIENLETIEESEA